MTPEQFQTVAIGTRVIVYAFGVHYGVVAEIEPTVIIQGRMISPPGWLKVKIRGKPDYNGQFADVDLAPVKAATFNHYHCANGGAVPIKMRAGQIITHSQGGDTDEGWERTSREWHFDGEAVTLEWRVSGADCDGRYDHYGKDICPVAELHAGSDVDGTRYPKWKTVKRANRDHSAEAMGY